MSCVVTTFIWKASEATLQDTEFTLLRTYTRAIATKFGVVRLVARTQYTWGAWGHAPPEKFWNLGVIRLLLRPCFDQHDASWRPDDRVHINIILTIASYSTGVSFSIQFAYRPKATPFAGEACETNRSLVRMKSRWKEDSRNSSVTLFTVVPMCFGTLCGHPPSKNANSWQRQASHKWGEK